MHFRLSKLFAVNDGLAVNKADTVFACPQACQAVNINCKHLRSKLSKLPRKDETAQRQTDITDRISISSPTFSRYTSLLVYSFAICLCGNHRDA